MLLNVWRIFKGDTSVPVYSALNSVPPPEIRCRLIPRSVRFRKIPKSRLFMLQNPIHRNRKAIKSLILLGTFYAVFRRRCLNIQNIFLAFQPGVVLDTILSCVSVNKRDSRENLLGRFVTSIHPLEANLFTEPPPVGTRMSSDRLNFASAPRSTRVRALFVGVGSLECFLRLRRTFYCTRTIWIRPERCQSELTQSLRTSPLL